MAKKRLFTVLCTTLLAAGCSDAERHSSPVLPSSPSTSLSATVERAALDELTRAVARALNDTGLRHRIKADLRASRVTVEHKLLLSDYMRGESGGMLLAKMSRETGKSRTELLSLIERVRPLEFYMPVEAHRETWTGGADLLVGSVLEDHTKPTVFDLAGRPVDVAVDAVPALPTLALVPVETDFSKTLDPKHFRNRNDRGGESIGTLVSLQSCQLDDPLCAPECLPEDIDCQSPPPYSPPVIPAGLYYTGSQLQGVGEGGLRGYPEIEVWVIRTYDPNKSALVNEPAFPFCQAGEPKSGRRYFNQDSEWWSGRALVLDSTEAATLNVDENSINAAPHGYTIQLWEDDTAPCQLRTTMNMSGHLGQLLAAGLPTFEAPRPPTWGRSVGPVFILFPTPIQIWQAITGYNDEFLGTAVPRGWVTNPGYAGYTHIMFRESSTRNGAIKLEFR